MKKSVNCDGRRFRLSSAAYANSTHENIFNSHFNARVNGLSHQFLCSQNVTIYINI